jgi:diguanylate cyclase (GGDEF)-like protein
LIDPRDLLELLQQHPLTAPLRLALYSEDDGRPGLDAAIAAICAQPGCSAAAGDSCTQAWRDSLSQALLGSQPAVHSCCEEIVCMVVPLPEGRDLPDCVLAAAVFEPEHAGLEEASTGADPVPRRLSMAEAESIAEELFRCLPRLLSQKLPGLSLDRATRRLEAVRKLARDLGTCREGSQAIATMSEALVVLFDLPKVLIVLQQPGRAMSIHSTLGLSAEAIGLDRKRLADYIEESPGAPETVSGETLTAVFPGIDARRAYLFPLMESSARLGVIALLDVELHTRDQALIEMLVGRLAGRLASLQAEQDQQQQRQLSDRLVAMISQLSQTDSHQRFYRQILDMAAELLDANSASLMLLNEADGTLTIEAARGMTDSLARSMSVPFGEGIAGKVAKSGFPMLVNDIEHDRRIATKNRPRFKTKSFLSLPLEHNGRLLGVLNLADKSDASSFHESDLQLAQTFTSYALQMLDRTALLEKAGQFELLAMTDPLTGLHNRRFLKDRLQEEFSRSERQQLDFCVIMLDLDNFKIYNDICGHLAGDKALRKAAELIRQSARDMDIVSRYGGEEFCMILPSTSKKESLFVAERIRRAIEAESFAGENHLPLGRLTVSLGVSSFPADGGNADDLVHAADRALYQAKAEGRNRLVLFDAKRNGALTQLQQDS